MTMHIRPEMAQHPLAQAARETNAYAEKHGLQATIERYDLAVEDVNYMAEQRALRCIYAFRGVNANFTEVTMVELSPAEQILFVKLVAAYMDGLVIGWVAKEKQMKNDEDKTSNKTT